MPQLDRYGYIPACAGETHGPVMSLRLRGHTVHPRVCGGNILNQILVGLVLYQRYIPACAGETSHDVDCPGVAEGYIPACAGETIRLPHLATAALLQTVHPRVCGGNPITPLHQLCLNPGYIPACAGETKMRLAFHTP